LKIKGLSNVGKPFSYVLPPISKFQFVLIIEVAQTKLN
jgi:hypothetical protein